jgi:pyrrolidone-carboxylate peptidase
MVLPVSWRRGPDLAIARARELDAALVVGLGVAVSRAAVCVERVGVRVERGMPDVDGRTDPLLDGPPEVRATLDTERLATALGATLSDDAGRYVCNAWIYRVTQALDGVPVGFVHVPSAGLAPQALLDALGALVDASGLTPRRC